MADFTYDTNTITGSAAQPYLVGKAIDIVLSYSPMTLFFLGNQKDWKGIQRGIPVKFAQNTQGISFDGLDRFSTTKTNNWVKMSFNPTGREIPCVLSGIEEDVVAADPASKVNLKNRQLTSDTQDMADDIAGLFWTLQTGKNFLSILDGIDDTDLGTTSYGGLSRTTYTGLRGTVTAVGGNLTAATMATLWASCTHGKDQPNLLVTDKTTWTYFEKLVIPGTSLQMTQDVFRGYPSFVGATEGGLPNIVAPGAQLKGGLGFNSLYYKGAPVIADEKITSGYMAFLNTRTWGFYGLPAGLQGYKPVKFFNDTIDSVYSAPVTYGFAYSDFNVPIDQYGEVAHLILMGNLICENPRLNGLLTGITGA